MTLVFSLLGVVLVLSFTVRESRPVVYFLDIVERKNPKKL